MKTILFALMSTLLFISLTGCSTYTRPKSYLYVTKKYCPHGLTLYTDSTCRSYNPQEVKYVYVKTIERVLVKEPVKKVKTIKRKIINKKKTTDCEYVMKHINQCMR